MTQFKVGDKVRLLKQVILDGDGCWPNVLIPAGDILIIRKVYDADECSWADCSVSHEEITDNSFGVKADEIEAAPDAKP